MEKDIVEGNIGSVGQYDLEFKGGKLCLSVSAQAGPGEMGLSIKVDAAKVVDALAKAIPGQVDDAIFGVFKAALLGA